MTINELIQRQLSQHPEHKQIFDNHHEECLNNILNLNTKNVPIFGVNYTLWKMGFGEHETICIAQECGKCIRQTQHQSCADAIIHCAYDILKSRTRRNCIEDMI